MAPSDPSAARSTRTRSDAEPVPDPAFRDAPDLDALLHAYGLKDEPRQGWLLRGIADPESVAAHSWGTSLLCLLFAEDAGVDPGEALAISTVHDLAEAEVGDIPSREDPTLRTVSIDTKAALEREAMDRLADALNGRGTRLRALWQRYEDRDDPAARFVRDMNLVDMALQALLYQRGGRHAHDADLREFLRSAEARVDGEVARTLLVEIRTAFEASLDDAAASTNDAATAVAGDGADATDTARTSRRPAPPSD